MLKPNDLVKFAKPEPGEESYIMRVIEYIPEREGINKARVHVESMEPLTPGAFVELHPRGVYLETDLILYKESE